MTGRGTGTLLRGSAGIARLTVLNACRSRALISLLIVLVLAIAGLACSVKGDGTLPGQVRVMLYYVTGVSFVIMSIVALWSGCGSVSSEIRGKQIQMVATKPVRALSIWLGKWAGLCLVHAVSLSIVGLATGMCLLVVVRQVGPDDGERDALQNSVLTTRREVQPVTDNVDVEAHTLYARLAAQGQIPADMPEAEGREVLARQLRMQHATVPVGHVREWTVKLPRRVARRADSGAGRCTVRARLQTMGRDRSPVRGTWIVAGTGCREPYRLTREFATEGLWLFDVPASCIGDEGVVTLRFVNEGGADAGSVIFDATDGITLLVTEGGFAMNLVRALLVMFCVLALLSAVGLTVGSFFSFPVAVFCAVALMIVSLVGHYFSFTTSPEQCMLGEHECGHDHGSHRVSRIEAAGTTVLEKLDGIIEPVMQLRVVAPLSEGVLISWSEVVRAFALLPGLYGVILALLGGLLLARKELALAR